MKKRDRIRNIKMAKVSKNDSARFFGALIIRFLQRCSIRSPRLTSSKSPYLCVISYPVGASVRVGFEGVNTASLGERGPTKISEDSPGSESISGDTICSSAVACEASTCFQGVSFSLEVSPGDGAVSFVRSSSPGLAISKILQRSAYWSRERQYMTRWRVNRR